jgi:hypothetical protein
MLSQNNDLKRTDEGLPNNSPLPQLKANFQEDWISHIRKCMITVQGWHTRCTEALNDNDGYYSYFDTLRLQRKIPAIPRSIKISDNFNCPSIHQAGWEILQQKVQSGQDINPYLSKKHASPTNADGLLAEWGVHHFHLGTTPDPINPNYMARTGPLLYAFIADGLFCAIDVFSHISFEDNRVLECIHRNWPEMISRYRAKGVTGESLSPDTRKTLRKKNTNVLSSVSDGTVYMPLTGGVMASGLTAEALRHGDYWLIEVDKLQKTLNTKLGNLLPELRRHGYTGEPKIEAKLQFVKTKAQAFFPSYDFCVVFAGFDLPQYLAM